MAWCTTHIKCLVLRSIIAKHGEKRFGETDMKYKTIIQSLPDDVIFIPSTIVKHAVYKGFIADIPLAQRRLRVSMSRLRQLRKFPDKGDGSVTLKKYRAYVGWCGLRWKLAIHPSKKVREFSRFVEISEYKGIVRGMDPASGCWESAYI